MAPAPPRGRVYANSKGNTIVTVCVILGILLLIIFVVYCLRNKPHDLRKVIAARYSQASGARLQHIAPKTIVKSLPVVKYSSLNFKPGLDIGADPEANIVQSAKSRGIISLPWHRRYMKWTALNVCTVCTEAFLSSDKVRVLPCGHFYHHGCIDRWLLMFAATCPICRARYEDMVETLAVNLPAPQPVHHPT